jgi:hypothetical protein
VNMYEQVLNLLWVLMGLGICIYSVGLKIMIASKTGSGLIPFLAGLILAIVGVVRLVEEWRKWDGKTVVTRFWETPTYRNRILFVLMGFFAMAFLLPKLGFLLASIVITSFLLYVIEPHNIFKVIGIALLTCFLVYLLFVIFLQVNLPKGFWGF